jgi:hypothetical protein
VVPSGELAELLVAADRAPLPPPRSPAFLEGGVVQIAMSVQQPLQRGPLTNGGLKQEPARTDHGVDHRQEV